MSQQIQITGGAKVRDLQDVIIGASGVLSSLGFDVANGVPKLDSNGKILVSQLPNSVMEYKGTWNAATNTPTLANGTGNQGDVYLCNVAGTVNFGAGPIAFIVGDSAVYSGSIWQRSGGATGSVTSVGLSTNGAAITIGSSPITTSGTISFNFNGTNLQYVNGAGNLTTFPTLITSIGLSMPSAFSVANSPLIANGTIAITGAGNASQYIRGDGTLAAYNPGSGGGGSSQVFYFNGGVPSDVVGYKQMSTVANTGASADFSINADGYIASFLTDAGSPSQLNIPAGNWNFEIFFNASSSGGTPSFYVELYKYASSTFTLISSSSANPEGITNGTSVDLYTTALAVPATTLTVTDRLAVRVYVTHSGRTITMHTQDSNLSEVITTFSTGITALNGLTTQVQYFQVGSAGTDFNISSVTDIHTFNIPSASASNRGLLTSSNWTTFNNKIGGTGTANYLSKFTGVNTIGDSIIYNSGSVVAIGTTTIGFNAYGLPLVVGSGIGNQGITVYSGSASYGSLHFAYGITGGQSYNGGFEYSHSTNELTVLAAAGASAIFKYNQVIIPYNGAHSAGSESLYVQENARINGQLSLGSTLTNGTYTYTLPGATGTLALTSDLAGYVTLATTQTISGSKTFSAATAFSSTTSHTGTASFGAGSPTAIDGADGRIITSKFRLYNTTPATIYSDFTSAATSNRSIVVPDASGTLALTSDLPTYGNITSGNTSFLTLTGGTGAIIGSGVNINIIPSGIVGSGLTLTTTGTSGQASFSSATATLNIPNYAPDLSGYVPYSGATGAVNLGSYSITAGGTSSFVGATLTSNLWLKNVGSSDIIISNAALSTINTVRAYYTTTDELRFYAKNTAGTSVVPKIMVGDGTTFTQLGTGTIGGTGTTNYLPKFTGTSTIGNSAITDDGTTVTLISRALNGTSASFSSSITALSSLITGSQPTQVISTIQNNDPTQTGGTRLSFKYNGTETGYIYNRFNGGDFNTDIGSNDYISFLTGTSGGSIKMRITSGGALQMSNNSTTFSIGSIPGVQRIQYGTGGYTTEFAFLQPNDGYTSIGAGAFNTRSDYRLKEDLKEFNGLSLVTDMKVYDFKWKEKDERNYGFMAHELQEVISYVVTGTKDGMFEDEPQMQGLDYSKLVPVLVKAIQEQQATITELTEKVNRLYIHHYGE